MNDYAIGMQAAIPTTSTRSLNLETKPDTDAYQLYRKGGFLAIQSTIGQWALSQERSGGSLRVAFSPMETLSYESDSTFQQILDGVLASALLLVWIVPYIRFVLVMTNEKETRIKETMRIMGMSEAAYAGSWFVQYLITAFIISFLLTLFGGLFFLKNSEWLIMFFVYFTNGLAVYGIINFFQSLFLDMKKA